MTGLPRRLVLLCGIFAAFALLVPLSQAALRAPPARWSSKALAQIDGIEYLSLGEFAHRFDLKMSRAQPGKRLALTRAGTRLEFEVDAREAEVNGLRAFMGGAIREFRKNPYISLIDAERFIGPMIEPYPGHARGPVQIIALDAGHGGKDKGKSNDRLGINEKTFTLDVVLRLKKILETAGFRVVLTRSDDRFIELEDRPALAEKAHADIFVSVHFNSVEAGASRVTGVEIFSMTPQFQFSTDDNQHEAKEPAKVLNPGNATDALNSRLAYEVHRQLVTDLKLNDRGHKRQRFKVLRLAQCPAILIEGGYLSNDVEARKIATAAYREQLAESVAKGIKNYTVLVSPKP